MLSIERTTIVTPCGADPAFAISQCDGHADPTDTDATWQAISHGLWKHGPRFPSPAGAAVGCTPPAGLLRNDLILRGVTVTTPSADECAIRPAEGGALDVARRERSPAANHTRLFVCADGSVPNLGTGEHDVAICHPSAVCVDAPLYAIGDLSPPGTDGRAGSAYLPHVTAPACVCKPGDYPRYCGGGAGLSACELTREEERPYDPGLGCSAPPRAEEVTIVSRSTLRVRLEKRGDGASVGPSWAREHGVTVDVPNATVTWSGTDTRPEARASLRVANAAGLPSWLRVQCRACTPPVLWGPDSQLAAAVPTPPSAAEAAAFDVNVSVLVIADGLAERAEPYSAELVWVSESFTNEGGDGFVTPSIRQLGSTSVTLSVSAGARSAVWGEASTTCAKPSTPAVGGAATAPASAMHVGVATEVHSSHITLRPIVSNPTPRWLGPPTLPYSPHTYGRYSSPAATSTAFPCSTTSWTRRI